MTEKEKREKIEQLILSYLKRNPDAGDTLEGIARWWLQLEQIETSVEEMAAACQKLEKMGIIKISWTKSGHRIYKINKDGMETSEGD